MPRPPRIEYAGAVYHVINRGVERRAIFSVSQDYEGFLGLIERLKQRHKVELFAYCLMPNHYHLFLRTALPNLHRFMKELNGWYSKIFNKRCRRIGPLFQGRYRAILVQNDGFALDVARYIHLNPVKAGLSDSPEAYRWSSYRQYVNKDAGGIADTGFLLGCFPGRTEGGRRYFRRFTMEEHDGEYDPREAKGGVVAGVAAFVDWVKREKIPRKKQRDMARWGELHKPGLAVKKSLERRIGDLTNDPKLRRKLLVYALKKSTPLSLKEIARMTGMRTIIAVSQVSRRIEMAGRVDGELSVILAKLDSRLRADQK